MASPRRPREDQESRDPRASALVSVIEPTVTAHGLHLEEVDLASGPTTTLRVVVDFAAGTEQVDLDTVAGLSEALSAVLDGADVLTEVASYDLEVSTPGATRPLTEPRHFARNVGRLLEIEREEGAPVVARLEEVADDGVVVAEQRPAPKKGMPVKYGDPVEIAFDAIRRARVQVEFSHKE
ncbi:ribosome maturation factor RimP [Nesterenkonia sp. HG001]|uniref:ribosome maturation factor RimP n=1 Tax=Nesterenkonia sp. HG001 TaxID=2983207 RepID=UPI002AC4FC36|nr:ribosome maturation factor RimP [Nesterenkonia sp. HG001]MDZ5076125.1 ribosome maturation factor RimP [Nesterenkonia sp. HG001]